MPGAAALPAHDVVRTPGGGASAIEQGQRPFIVGIGMSAGGLEACTQMLEALPAAPGAAMVLIGHLAPHHRSALPSLLRARSSMKVIEAADKVTIEPNTVYVIPPDVLIEVADTKLRLLPRPTDQGQVLPVDFFLTSLATVQGDRAVAVILSGTGSDGAQGVRVVKERGGVVFVQKPETAKYDGMPQAAIATGAADMVLPPAGIAGKLVDLAEHKYTAPAFDALKPPGTGEAEPDETWSEEQFDEIFDLLRGTSGVDFAHYKQPTIKRRILRRMALYRVSTLNDYLQVLRTQPQEIANLYKDILIHVTRFFREPESFQTLATHILPKLLHDRKPDNPVRMWVAGCATGEEAYSLAMAVIEAAGDALPTLAVQVFATDVSETAVEFARQGIYPASIVDDVPADKLRRFFTRADGGYRISKVVRDVCVFARQDLTRDPPFSKLDLVLCRNVLIYMDVTLQRKVLPIFHYALRADGYLVLGQAETIGSQSELFTLVDKKHKIYRKKAADQAFVSMPAASYALARPRAGPTGGADYASDVRAVQNEANRAILDRYSPPGVLVNESLEIVQFRGHTGPYLEPPPGDASLNLLKLAREGLLHGLRSALQAARKTHKPVRKEGLHVRSNGGWTETDLEVLPLTSLRTLHFLVLFRPAQGAPPPEMELARRPKPPLGRGAKNRADKLEQELASTREYLQSIIQEVEAANEELQSANEEILSSNEELQSTNEELDTAKEELQSTNEELNTLNDELHARNEELTRANNDLVNLLGSVHVAVVIVSTDLRIRRFTPMAEKMLNLIAADVGRPITQVKPNIEIADLGELISEVIDHVAPLQRDVRDREGGWFSLRIRPYKGVENRIEGAVITVEDTDATKRHELQLALERDYSAALVAISHEPLAVLDRDARIAEANEPFCRMLRVSRAEAEGQPVYEIGDRRLDVPAMHELLERVLGRERRVDGYEIPDTKPGASTLRVNAQAVPEPGDETHDRFVLAFGRDDAGQVP
jgi:two-component system CheB/CheR fusion protein